jgi:UDP-GlcNAc:undecaprenyl-phosphate GlcNAc-1-phosphate transferase
MTLLAAVENEILKGFRYPLLAALIALIVSWLLTPWVRSLAIAKGAVDDPKIDDRRMHYEPTPRWGGLAIYAGLLASLLVVLPFAYGASNVRFPIWLIGLILVGGALVVVGALDDLYQYKAKIQALLLLTAGFVIQLFAGPEGRIQIATLGIPFGGGAYWKLLPLFTAPLTAFYIFVVTKTMDTIDGIDGLAAGLATISAATLTIIAVYGGQPRVALVAAALAGAALGFLKHNYNPARIFMGTGGAYVLGFTLACLSIVGALKTAAAASLIIPALVFGVPIFDAFFVIVRRIASGQPITQADKRHVHHTLIKRGLSQKQTVWVLYLVTAVLCVTALLVIRRNG